MYSGLRPGEKLCEELNLADEQTVPTRHAKIKAFTGTCLPFERVTRHLGALRNACEARDLRTLMLELKDIVPDYNPSKEMLHKITEPGLFRLSDAVDRETGSTPEDSGFSPISVAGAPCYRELS